MTPGFELGYRAFVETLMTGGDIAALLNEQAQRGKAGNDSFIGAVSALGKIFIQVREAGHALPIFEDTAVRNFVSLGQASLSDLLNFHTQSRSPKLSAVLSAMVLAVHTHRAAVTVAAPQPPAQPDPLPVKIVSMPDRVRESTIERDKNGNIDKATQIERDVTPTA